MLHALGQRRRTCNVTVCWAQKMYRVKEDGLPVWRFSQRQKKNLLFLQPKCDLYWPDAGSETYGDFIVSLLREDVLASYTLRTFSLRYMRPSTGTGTLAKKDLSNGLACGLERTIYQYHFTAWPDHGVPLHALPLVSFVRNTSAAANTPSADLDASGPIVVHCR